MNNDLKELKKIAAQLEKDLGKISKLIEKIEKEDSASDPKNLPGAEGTFDGKYMVTDKGDKHEVSANYAAKSRLVFGDKLKRVEVDGKVLFKNIEKVQRKEVSGVLSKKEGLWYFLTDSGSYKVSETAAEFNKVKINDEAVALIPKDNLSAPYAALDRVIRDKRKEKGGEEVVEKSGGLALERKEKEEEKPPEEKPKKKQTKDSAKKN